MLAYYLHEVEDEFECHYVAPAWLAPLVVPLWRQGNQLVTFLSEFVFKKTQQIMKDNIAILIKFQNIWARKNWCHKIWSLQTDVPIIH